MNSVLGSRTLRFALGGVSALGLLLIAGTSAVAQAPRRDTTPAAVTLLAPARVFDGTTMHDGWIVLVRGNRIEAAGPSGQITAPAGATTVRLAGLTLMPGMIESDSTRSISSAFARHTSSPSRPFVALRTR